MEVDRDAADVSGTGSVILIFKVLTLAIDGRTGGWMSLGSLLHERQFTNDSFDIARYAGSLAVTLVTVTPP